ncbi:NBR1-Ig-like domain-containing protein [Aeoliella sp. ICT_H6.2]|uniref:NBR1-Ig-like domain-containing protein n=1 Tax=Aeoliella straminimaris TaxID=2954799 RepID=A0A9X2FD36_9BACT|nr:NBR1-Ig-like domain-containing protein [Aeoliella straminimaris]MCO6046745.1 NBR1-Ig-like domain-containing protein [Aeoliella straminimaris]
MHTIARNSSANWVLALSATLLTFAASIASAQQVPADLSTPGRSFELGDKIVSTSFFVWYRSDGGQQDGPWLPIEGRENWTGEVPFWKTQIKQVMAANIDAMNVHLTDDFHQQRRNLFAALRELRREGYDVPKVTPFLDPIIIWGMNNSLDVSTAEGKDTFVGMYSKFYQQYFDTNPDEHADSYLTHIDGRTVLDVWHVHHSLAHLSSLTRAEVQGRLAAEFAAQHAMFHDDIYMITTAVSPATLGFADEKVVQFETQAYFDPRSYNSLRTVQLKPGYWDQNIRDPGYFLPRAGGSHYAAAWAKVASQKSSIDRVYVESWNEYAEGTGIYAADTRGAQVLDPPNDSGNTDTWSSDNDPYQYIRTTAEGARQYNDVADLDARILWHNLPETLRPGQTVTAQVIVRNTGDVRWTGAAGFQFGQNEQQDVVLFGTGRYKLNDEDNEIPTYGGIFRGRPVKFDVTLTAPAKAGRYETHWQMLHAGDARFGEELTHAIDVVAPEDARHEGTAGLVD